MKKIERRSFLGSMAMGAAAAGVPGLIERPAVAAAAEQPAESGKANERRTFASGRHDGRFTSTTGFVHAYLKNICPKLAFDPGMKADAFGAWREAVRRKLRELMRFPEVPPQPPPKRLWTQQRDGYQLQKWEACPEPFSVVPFLLLIPDGVSPSAPGPATVCFPGSTSSKESLAGELELGGKRSTHRHWERNRMALYYARKGIVTVAVDNPGTCETADPIRPSRHDICVHALWAGRSYEGISVFQKRCILQWLKQQPFVDADRIATSGHSLGAKPALILGVLDPTVKAVVWNDFCSDWRDRAVATNLQRISIHQYVPGLHEWFDYCDLEASLAPRPLLITEGGRTEDIDRIREAYKLVGAPDRIEVAYYPKFATPDQRPFDDKPLPEGLSMEEYFDYANVDVPMHSFKGEVAVPWLAEVLGA